MATEQQLHYRNVAGLLVRTGGFLFWKCPVCHARGKSKPVRRVCPECKGKGPKRETVKESVMGTYAQQKVQTTCDHEFVSRPAVLFGYLEVDERCTKCKTWRAIPRG